MHHKRRSFIKLSAVAAAWLGLPQPNNAQGYELDQIKRILERPTPKRPDSQQPVFNLRKNPISQVKVALLGLGNRGTGQARLVNALYPEKAKITAICDLREARIAPTLEALTAVGQKPAVYSGREDAWMEMCRRDDVDLV
ncbi:MAG: twin-arginine translocation signal domain-containing protein, partial [Saprospiraceae bacterium]|nr:twin-arginine translocation signal domain-containing protein [Saprospiraceae bacterium]